jgi:site-specific recombinase XerD
MATKTVESKRMTRQMAAVSLGMLIEYYAGSMRQKNRTPDSIRTNQSTLERFARFAGGRDVRLNRVTPQVASAFVDHLQGQTSKWENHPTRPPTAAPLSPYTVRKEIKILRGFGHWMEREGFGNPFCRLEIPTVPKELVETLTQEEIHRILDTQNAGTVNGARNLAVVMLMLDSGPRISEVADLRLAHLNLEDREVKIMGKGRKERRIPFGQDTAKALMRYITMFRPEPAKTGDDHVFLSLDACPMSRNGLECIIRRMRESSGVNKLHAHLLRHTFSVNFLAAGGDLETLRRILGHESLEVTKRYLRGLQDAQVRAKYQEFSPVDRMNLGSRNRRFGQNGVAVKKSVR